MKNEFSISGFIKAIPEMAKKVWPGFWPLIVIISVCLFFGNAPLNSMSFSDWAILHVIIVAGMISLTIWLYNIYQRPLANLPVIGIWLLATALCMLSDWILQGLSG